MEFIRFVFSSFWTWVGFLILIGAVGEAVASIVKAAHTPRKIEAYRVDSRWHVQIDGAHRGDISEIMNNADKQSNVGVAE